MRVGSLFSGIGGLDLGLERAGMTVVWQSEIDPYASRVLAKHWPNVPNLGDITTIDWSSVEDVDVICGGYPCQPFSLVGDRRGESDARHLWPHMRDAIGVLRPRVALLENVPGHLSMGFGRVLGDLAELGYDAEWDCIPAAAVGAPHLRYRIFLVAHANGQSESSRSVDAVAGSRVVVPDAYGNDLRQQPVRFGWSSSAALTNVDGEDGQLAYANSTPRDAERPASEEVLRSEEVERFGRRGGSVHDSYRFEADGVAEPWGERGIWATEPDVGRVAHGVPARMDRLRCLGNAVVPQVAELVGRRIMAVAA